MAAAACSSSSTSGSPGSDAGLDSSTAVDSTTGEGGADGGNDATESETGNESGAGDAGDAGVEAGEAGPPPVVLVSDAPNAWLIATDGTSVYWIDWVTTDAGQQNGRVMQVAVDGGGETPLAITPGVIPVGLAIDTGNVYWTESDSKLWQVSKSGGTPTLLQDAAVAAPLTAAGGFVYFRPTGDSGVEAVPVDGGAVTALSATGNPVDLAVVAGGVYWADATGHIAYVTIADAGTPAYLVNGFPGQYVSATIYQNLTTDGTSLYWPRGPGANPSGVMAIPLSGGTPQPLVDAGTDSPRSVVTDGIRVYYLDVTGSVALVAIPVDGGTPVTITTAGLGSADISGTPGPTIAIDSTSVYWLNPPQIMRIAK